MKQEKGVTLISLTIYVIVMAIVIGVLAIITNFFYKNVKDVNVDIDPITQYTTFNSYFSEEVNHSNIKVLECKDNYIVFDNGVQYSFIEANKGIYKDNVKICRNVDNCTFYETIENGKTVIKVTFESGKQQKETKYSLKN